MPYDEDKMKRFQDSMKKFQDQGGQDVQQQIGQPSTDQPQRFDGDSSDDKATRFQRLKNALGMGGSRG